MTLEELVLCIIEQSNKIKEEPKENISSKQIEDNSSDNIYSINQLIENYPIFTRYNINKAIIEKGLPYFCLGSKKYFKQSEIEKWMEKQQLSQQNNRRY